MQKTVEWVEGQLALKDAEFAKVYAELNLLRLQTMGRTAPPAFHEAPARVMPSSLTVPTLIQHPAQQHLNASSVSVDSRSNLLSSLDQQVIDARAKELADL